MIREIVPEFAWNVRFGGLGPVIMDPGLAEAHAEFVARVVRSVGGAAVKDATVVHPQGAFFQIEADRVETRIDFGAAAEQVVEFGRAAVFGYVLGTGNEFETAVLLVGIDQGEFGADGECRSHDSGKGGGLAVAMPGLILGKLFRLRFLKPFTSTLFPPSSTIPILLPSSSISNSLLSGT